MHKIIGKFNFQVHRKDPNTSPHAEWRLMDGVTNCSFLLTPQPGCPLLGFSLGVIQRARGEREASWTVRGWSRGQQTLQTVKRVCVCVCGSVGIVSEVRFRSGCLCTLRLRCAAEVKPWSPWGTLPPDRFVNVACLLLSTCSGKQAPSPPHVQKAVGLLMDWQPRY